MNVIRRISDPSAYQRELKWFSKAFRQPETICLVPKRSIDRFKDLIWEKPSDSILPIFGKKSLSFPMAPSLCRFWIRVNPWLLSQFRMHDSTMLSPTYLFYCLFCCCCCCCCRRNFRVDPCRAGMPCQFWEPGLGQYRSSVMGDRCSEPCTGGCPCHLPKHGGRHRPRDEASGAQFQLRVRAEDGICFKRGQKQRRGFRRQLQKSWSALGAGCRGIGQATEEDNLLWQLGLGGTTKPGWTGQQLHNPHEHWHVH